MHAVRSGLAFGMLVALGMLAAAPAPAGPGKGNGRGRDRAPPTITCPGDVTARATSPEGAVVTFSATATDNKDPYPTIAYSPAPGSTFPIGTTTVTVTATDWMGNVATCEFAVTVQEPLPVAAFAGSYAWSTDTYLWSMTISADGTVSGVGHQTALELTGWFAYSWQNIDGGWVSDWFEWSELVAMPSDLSATGSLTGSVAEYGWVQVHGAYEEWVGTGDFEYWWGTEFESLAWDYWLTSQGLSFAGQASLDADGNVVITDSAGGVTIWYRQ